ncbi:hypothetical protein QBC35DRAFT_500343 [Podospora australis]|uniref:Uncharacterized protein n=1 Tax=Podospora australis TaxID=1536484 RepID=A0AAN6WSX5_9PEZI|nr:hypothetical protein QBC35DRAFT_500343 [Podospora australis]
MSTPNFAPAFSSQESLQTIEIRNIDPEKLADKLKVVFKGRPVRVQMRHDVYCIRGAPRNLRQEEIAECSFIIDKTPTVNLQHPSRRREWGSRLFRNSREAT